MGQAWLFCAGLILLIVCHGFGGSSRKLKQGWQGRDGLTDYKELKLDESTPILTLKHRPISSNVWKSIKAPTIYCAYSISFFESMHIALGFKWNNQFGLGRSSRGKGLIYHSNCVNTNGTQSQLYVIYPPYISLANRYIDMWWWSANK